MSQDNQTQVTDAEEFGYSATPQGEATTPVVETPSLSAQEQINQAIKEVTVGDDGKYVYPEDMDPMLKQAVATEKKYRDTQSGYTKSQMSNKELEAENGALHEQLATNVQQSLELSPEDTERLDDLKYTNPDEWHKQLTVLTAEQQVKAKEELTKQTTAIKTEAGQAFESDRRALVLEEFNEGREVPITNEVVASDVPPRITNKLKDGKISFEEFLSEVGTYLGKRKTVANPADPALPDLHKETGGSVATKMETEAELDYSGMTF